MRRIIWLSICLFLAPITIIQADTYRDSQEHDDGFNPMGMMQGMPHPMSMFDSSERRWDARRRLPPPPPPAPGYPYGYARPPAYVPPPGGQIPYGYPPQPIAPPTPGQAVSNEGSSATTESRQTDTTPIPQQPVVTPEKQNRSADYSFRPMTPMQPELDKTAPTEGPTSTATPTKTWQDVQTPITSPEPDTASSSRKALPPVTEKSEEVMINGKPAVFRPMHLGVEPPTE